MSTNTLTLNWDPAALGGTAVFAVIAGNNNGTHAGVFWAPVYNFYLTPAPGSIFICNYVACVGHLLNVTIGNTFFKLAYPNCQWVNINTGLNQYATVIIGDNQVGWPTYQQIWITPYPWYNYFVLWKQYGCGSGNFVQMSAMTSGYPSSFKNNEWHFRMGTACINLPQIVINDTGAARYLSTPMNYGIDNSGSAYTFGIKLAIGYAAGPILGSVSVDESKVAEPCTFLVTCVGIQGGTGIYAPHLQLQPPPYSSASTGLSAETHMMTSSCSGGATGGGPTGASSGGGGGKSSGGGGSGVNGAASLSPSFLALILLGGVLARF